MQSNSKANVRDCVRKQKKRPFDGPLFCIYLVNLLIHKEIVLVAWGGIEPPTQGFSILCSTD